MNLKDIAGKGEKGQALPLFGLLITTLLLFALAVVDVGFFLHERQRVQAAADAAALAGAQELPDSPGNAQAVALEYLEKNEVSQDDVTISFRCTSGYTSICDASAGTYDTIAVTPKSSAPQFFGGILAMTGSDSCWVTGCGVEANAAACRGACGPIGTGPADIMVVLDHSFSMSDSDLANAKNATLSMFEDLNHQYQRVGLAVTPPVNPSPGNTCDSINNWGETPNWMPAGLTFGFQSSPHNLNMVSGPAYQTNCVDRTSWIGGELTDYPLCSCHTNVGSPLQDATNEIIANGRITDANGNAVVHGIVLRPAGASNVAPLTTTTTTSEESGDTGWNSCDDDNDEDGQGDGNGFQNNSSSACANGGSYASDSDSGTNTNTSCTNSGKDKHRFWDFDLDDDIPNNATINGIEVRLDAWANGWGTKRMCVSLSSNGGSSWTDAVYVNLGSGQTTYYLGGSSDLWGRSWDDDDFDTDDFRVRITNVGSSWSSDFYLDYIAVKVHYTDTDTDTETTFDGSLGPCDWAVQQATAAKAAGIEVYVIGFGLSSGEQCHDFAELPSSPYYNWHADDLLEYLATDSEHFFNEPKSEDLEPVFQEIGAQLVAKGSRLVE